MKNDIELHTIFEMVNKITQQGKKTEKGFHYMGIELSTDLEGYSIELYDAYCRLTLDFHNKYHLDYDNDKCLQAFKSKLDAIGKS